MKKMALICAAVLLLNITGCSAFKRHSEWVTVTCTPTDVNLVINDEKHKCPVETWVRRNRNATIEARKDGYRPQTITIGHHFSGSGAMDIVGTALFFFPVIGLVTPGAWNLDKTEISIIMEKEEAR